MIRPTRPRTVADERFSVLAISLAIITAILLGGAIAFFRALG